MSTFESLTLACDGWFDKPLADLPQTLRQRLDDEFSPMPWDRLSAAGRRSITLQLDYPDDPATERERHFNWDWTERKHSLHAQIAQWEAVAAPTAGDLAAKESRLAKLIQDLNLLDKEVLTPQNSDLGSPEWRSQKAREAANVLHDKPGGSRDKKRQIQEIWASGKYTTRDICAEQECAALGMSFATARKALKNAQAPGRC
jgi:hypothetical protein